MENTDNALTKLADQKEQALTLERLLESVNKLNSLHDNKLLSENKKKK